MNSGGLTQREEELIQGVLRRHPEITEAKLFGSRAKGTARPNSDVDLALRGEISPLLAATVAGELEELPLPYTFDVQGDEQIRYAPLRQHIDRAGITFYLKS